MFLADHAVVGEACRDQRPHGGLGLAVGDRHRALVVLAFDLDRAAEVAARNLSGRVRQAFGERHEDLGAGCARGGF